MHSLLAICVLLAAATDGAPGHPFSRWLARGQTLAPRPWTNTATAAAANRDESLPASAVDTAWFKAASDTGNTVLYFVQTTQELFVFGGVPPAVSGPTPTPDTTAPSTGISAPSTNISAPSTDTSVPTTNTSAPSTDTSVPTTNTSASSTDTSEPATDYSAPSTGASVSYTETSTRSASGNSQPTSTIPPEYTYYPDTGSYYKIHKYQATWDDANATCASEGAELVVLNDAEEARLVAQIVNNPRRKYYATWTGLQEDRLGGGSDSSTYYGENSGVYTWRTPYGATESSTARSCVVFGAEQRQLYGFPCDSTWHFTCEISK